MSHENDPADSAFSARFGPEFAHGRAFDAARMRSALARLGDPHARLPPLIHVAGTNAKGSTIAFMRAIAEAAGMRVHAFVKPHLFRLGERFIIAGAEAADDALIAASDEIVATGASLTHFEAQVCAALLLFARAPAHLCLIETGMGGALDATNVFDAPAACVITPIGLDHEDMLGGSLAAIAQHKAGILRPRVPVICARQAPQAEAVIMHAAAALDAPLFIAGHDWDAFASPTGMVVQSPDRLRDLPRPALVGPHQIDNAGLAIAALDRVIDIADTAIARGVGEARWPARMAPITRGALAERANAANSDLWLDGAHNAHAARALIATLDELDRRTPRPRVFIVGMLARKRADEFLQMLAPSASALIAISPDARFAQASQLAHTARALGASAQAADSLTNAVAFACEQGGARIVICGSLALAEYARAAELTPLR